MKPSFFNRLLYPFRKSKPVLVSFLLMLVSLMIVLAILAWICAKNKVVVTYVQNGNFPSESEKKELYITMEIPVRSDGMKNCWQQPDGSWGSQYDIYIHNRGMFPFIDWILEMKVPEDCRIDSSWNGDYLHTGEDIFIHGDADARNLMIFPGSEGKLGFVLYSDELIEESTFNLTGKFHRRAFRDKSFLLALSLFFIFGVAFIVTIILFYLLEKQTAKDEEKIDNLLKLCARFIDVRDEYTKMHSSHVGYYAMKIAEEMGFDDEYQRIIYYMGMMHDVGKVMISRDILCKTGKLTLEEWDEMKMHTVYGAEILKDFSSVPGIMEAALYHHERWDGAGYMHGLKGEAIPLQARIICVADAYDAMNTDRSYRKRLSDEVIVQEIEMNRGSQFDPKVADAMLRLLKNKQKKLVYKN